MLNKYMYHTKISEAKFREILRMFAADLTAVQTTLLIGLNRKTINRLYSAIRRRIAEYSIENSPFKGEIEADESYFGPRRVKGKRGRGASGKTIVFGLFKRGDKVYTEIVPDVKAQTLQGIIRGQADIESVIHTDGWRGYDGLVDLGYEKHYRVNHGDNEFSEGNGNHINGIECFWSVAKHRFAKFRGIPREQLELFLKETEFRFNHRSDDLYKLLLKWFRQYPL